MSKFSDAIRLDIAQSNIDRMVANASALRAKIEGKNVAIFDEWQTQKAEPVDPTDKPG